MCCTAALANHKNSYTTIPESRFLSKSELSSHPISNKAFLQIRTGLLAVCHSQTRITASYMNDN